MHMGCTPHRQNPARADDCDMPIISTRLERLVIFAADKEGRIPIPKGEKSGLQTIRKALAQLKKRGLVRKEEIPHADCSPSSSNRVLMVPRGMPVLEAISRWLNPP